MNRAFVREQDVEAFEALPDRPISPHPNDVTQQGLSQLESRLNAAREAHAAALAAQDRAAMAHASRELTQVRFGSSVSIRREDGREQTFRIVGEDEADPATGAISHVSPLARLLIGKCVGDVVQLGSSEVEIKAIR